MASASLSGFSMTGWGANSFRPQLPLPRVVYPPCCPSSAGLRYFMQSKILALAFLVLGIAFLVSFVCAFLPFWFFLHFNIKDSTFGTEGPRQWTKDLGVMFYTGDDYVSLSFLEKMSNRQVVPMRFKMVQVMEVLSIAIIFASFAGSGILAMRKYSSVTGVLFLAALSTVGAVGQILMVVFCAVSLLGSANDVCEVTDAGCHYTDNQIWRNLPFWEQHRRINPHTTPMMSANWGFYIAIMGAVLAVVGCVLLWIEGLQVCRAVSNIRYQQLSKPRDLHEGEKHPTDFIFSPPRGGATGPPPGQQYYTQPRQTYRPAPSASSYTATRSYTESSYSDYPPQRPVQAAPPAPKPYVSREIDL